jgi:hypothetical protein
MGNSENILDGYKRDKKSHKMQKLPGRQDSAIINERGREILCPKPAVEIHNAEGGSDTELDRIRRMIRTEFSQTAQDHGFESFEEANDFDTGEPDDDLIDAPETRYMKEEWLAIPPSREQKEPTPPQPNVGGG